MIICPVPYENIDQIWPLVEPMLKKVYDRTRISDYIALDAIPSKAKDGQLQLWVVLQDNKLTSAFLTTLEQAEKKICRVFALSGVEYQHDWQKGISKLEEWAFKIEGCQVMQIEGRRGWERVFRSEGYELDSILLTKDLST